MTKRSGWTRNLRLKIGATIVALLATLGFYGLIQANPLTHSSVANTPAGGAVAAPSDGSAPSAASSGSAAQSAPSNSDAGAGSGVAPAPAPFSGRRVTRSRSS